jgi:dolichyl-diphosphooligosaccharide--protein glycosyltransferase
MPPTPDATPAASEDGMLGSMMKNGVRAAIIAMSLVMAYSIRLYAINTYGLVIHEFDPWFNFRATQYLFDNGWTAFFRWFDYMSWYPLGRPVGTTIYPGMQITSICIHEVLNNYLGIEMSLNDICCMVPCWFGVSATAFLGLLTYECSGNANAAAASTLIMAIIPAHIMRSVGGGYDNESIALTAMCSTFFWWCRSIRSQESWPIGIITGFSYIYMVAAWGGYIFVLNMIGLHAGVLFLMGRYSSKIFKAYGLFYVIGTFGATFVPVVGMTPLKSLEQLIPGFLFLFFAVVEGLENYRKKQGWKKEEETTFEWWKLLNPKDSKSLMLYIKVFSAFLAALVCIIAILLPTGYFGPLSSRVRSLFVKHTRTGNPLVDSVAEHQPAHAQAYWQFLHYMCYVAPIGFVISLLRRTDSNIFLVCYGVVAYFFSSKMSRLIILLGPIASATGGIALSAGFTWAMEQFSGDDAGDDKAADSSDNKKGGKKAGGGKKGGGKRAGGKNADVGGLLKEIYNNSQTVLVRKGLAVLVLGIYWLKWKEFYIYCHQMAEAMSNPSIMFKAKLQSGETIIVDDYREAYWWLRDNTPEDARVMAWWDYGYQITGIGNRTTIADGNTWNHEHIATLGRCLTSPEKKAHKLIKHLADYVLIWTGGGGDDLAKSPHMARIGTSVYEDICPGDPTCRDYGFTDRQGTPTPMMAKSLLYRLHSHNAVKGVQVDPERFTDVFRSKYNKVRIFKVMNVSPKSKKWVADPANKICDAPGSWYCSGQYPPAMMKKMSKFGKKDFAQVEDWNKKKDDKAKKHYDEYMKKMGGDE